MGWEVPLSERPGRKQGGTTFRRDWLVSPDGRDRVVDYGMALDNEENPAGAGPWARPFFRSGM